MPTTSLQVNRLFADKGVVGVRQRADHVSERSHPSSGCSGQSTTTTVPHRPHDRFAGHCSTQGVTFHLLGSCSSLGAGLSASFDTVRP